MKVSPFHNEMKADAQRKKSRRALHDEQEKRLTAMGYKYLSFEKIVREIQAEAFNAGVMSYAKEEYAGHDATTNPRKATP